MNVIIPMKEHSERIPYKNIKAMHGMPLLYWSINTLLQSKHIDNIYIDTDSKVIKYLVNTIWYDKRLVLLDRPRYLLGDDVTANSLIAGVLSRVDGDEFLMTHVTSPLLKVTTINIAISVYRELEDYGFDSLISVTPSNSNYYYPTGIAVNHNSSVVTMSQNRELLYEENSAIYIFSRDSFGKYGRVGSNPYLFPICKLEAIDIDTEEDWIIAEALLCADI